MENETVTGPDGRKWTRSQDGRTLTCEDGSKVIGNPEMNTAYLLSVAYLDSPSPQTPADLGPLVKVEEVPSN